jgi:Uma2 family endonuclease
MSITFPPPHVPRSALPPLENGDHLDQKTFHARYEAMPEHVKAELIGGIVYMASPLKVDHGTHDREVGTWLNRYKAFTPGTLAIANTTAILGEDSEPQPDSALIVLAECGGQTRVNKKGYLEGSPELIAEIGGSSAGIDLHSKKRDYEKAGVREYIVVVLQDECVVWFTRRNRRFQEIAPGPDGIIRSQVFPGLWLDPAALFRLDTLAIEQVLQLGLASPEHGAFVKKLAAARV